VLKSSYCGLLLRVLALVFTLSLGLQIVIGSFVTVHAMLHFKDHGGRLRMLLGVHNSYMA
jgi:hypothetical protein